MSKDDKAAAARETEGREKIGTPIGPDRSDGFDLKDWDVTLRPSDETIKKIEEIEGARPAAPQPRKKGIHIGAPACFALDLAAQHINAAFGRGTSSFGCYVVGSCLERPDWRDIDVRLIMRDSAFAELFPDAGDHWEFDPRWLLLTVAISKWMSEQTGLPIDFQFQPQSHANAKHKGRRNAIGLRMATPSVATEKEDGR